MDLMSIATTVLTAGVTSTILSVVAKKLIADRAAKDLESHKAELARESQRLVEAQKASLASQNQREFERLRTRLSLAASLHEKAADRLRERRFDAILEEAKLLNQAGFALHAFLRTDVYEGDDSEATQQKRMDEALGAFFAHWASHLVLYPKPYNDRAGELYQHLDSELRLFNSAERGRSNRDEDVASEAYYRSHEIKGRLRKAIPELLDGLRAEIRAMLEADSIVDSIQKALAGTGPETPPEVG